MIKTIGFFVLWLAGSVAAVAVAWTGVSIVDDELIDPAPAINQIAAGDPSTTADASTTPGSAPTPSPVADRNPTTISSGNEGTPPETAETLAGSTPTASPQPTTTPTESPAAEPSPTTAPTPTSTATPPPSPTTATPAPPTPTTAPTQTLTFNLVGGSTAISFSPAGVDVLWATPNPGFTVKINPESPGIKVEFEADHHESRIDAWWAGGPQHEIREKADD